MDGTQFLVQWDEHPSHLATRLGYLLEHQSLVDVTLMCNTHTLKVHRAVLAACSPYFERQLGNHPLIVLKDMQFSVLKSLVEFMYCGETSVSEENLTPLLEAAKFFEVKGLSSMTKETVCTPNSPPTNSSGIKHFNGTPTPTTSGYSRGSGRGRGRGRGRPPLNPTSKIGSPTESAQILLSLSGNSPQLYTTSKNVKIDPAEYKGKMEPRRRGRKRGALNTAFRERILQEDPDSPLLSSLLKKQEQPLSNDVPILIDNGDGKLLSLSEDSLKMDGLLRVADKKKPLRPFVAKEVRTVRYDGEEIKEEPINEEVIENLKNGEADLEPDAVVLFEVTDDKKVEKFVLSAKDVSMLKSLNEQLANQKKELNDITKSDLSTVDVVGTNTKIAELKLKIGKTKSILSQFVHLKEKLKNFLPDGSDEVSSEKRVIPEMLHLEFVDGNGEKIGGYDLRGTIEDKRGIPKDNIPKEGDFMGLFDMVCADPSNDQSNPMLSDNSIKKLDRREEEILPNVEEGKEMSYQLVLDDHNENISYDHIEAMMSDSSGNIVIEEKTPDLKYIIDNEGNIMNQDESYVVYESGNVIYDNPESILPDVSEGENSNTYVVPDRVIQGEGTQYIVEYNDKTDLNDEIKELDDRGDYIVYHDGKENYEEAGDSNYSQVDHNFDSTQEEHTFESNHTEHNFDTAQEETTFESNHTEHNFENNHGDNNFESNLVEEGVVKDSECNDHDFVIYNEEEGKLSKVKARVNGETRRRTSSESSELMLKRRKLEDPLPSGGS